MESQWDLGSFSPFICPTQRMLGGQDLLLTSWLTCLQRAHGGLWLVFPNCFKHKSPRGVPASDLHALFLSLSPLVASNVTEYSQLKYLKQKNRFFYVFSQSFRPLHAVKRDVHSSRSWILSLSEWLHYSLLLLRLVVMPRMWHQLNSVLWLCRGLPGWPQAWHSSNKIEQVIFIRDFPLTFIGTRSLHFIFFLCKVQ